MLKSRDKVGYIFHTNYAQDLKGGLMTHTHTGNILRLLISKLYQKLNMITGLPVNPIIYVSSSNFLLKIPSYYFIFSNYFEVKCYKIPIFF